MVCDALKSNDFVCIRRLRMDRRRSGTKPLTRRALNRATLARQMLLARERRPLLAALEHLVALQAQLARPPYLALWTRLQGFRREDLTRAVHDRHVARGTLLRGTLHLTTKKDFLALRPAVQPVLTRMMSALLRDRLDDADVPRVLAESRGFFAEEPRTFNELRAFLEKRFPKNDVRAMGFTVRMQLPLVQVPAEDAPWGFPGMADFALTDAWLGRKRARATRPQDLVLRYLAALGPATVADAQTWSGLDNLREAFESLRPKLSTFRDERGRELFDLPRAPRPQEDAPAPVRFLPDFDNVILSHADRTRVLADEHRKRVYTANLIGRPTFLVDGFVAGTWSIASKRGASTLALTAFAPLAKKTRDDLEEEGLALLRFSEPEAKTYAVRVAKT